MACVVDATNLRLHLRFVLELRALGRSMNVALNTMDAAARRGIRIEVDALQTELGLSVVGTVAVKRDGADGLMRGSMRSRWNPWPRPRRNSPGAPCTTKSDGC